MKELLDSLTYFTEENASAQHVKLDSLAISLKQEAAKLLNASEDEIAITGTSTSQGVQIALESIRPQKGENIVTTDLEFPLAGVEAQKWRERGAEIRVWRHKNGTYSLDDLANLVDKNTKVILLSSVTWVNGYKFDLEEVSKIARP